jgi:hypothetical protein
MKTKKYVQLLAILFALVTIGFLFVKNSNECRLYSRYNNTLQRDINMEKICNDRP